MKKFHFLTYYIFRPKFLDIPVIFYPYENLMHMRIRKNEKLGSRYIELIFLRIQSWPTSRCTQSKIFLGRFSDYGGQACDVTPDFCGIVQLIILGPWLAYVAFIEGNFPQWGPQYIYIYIAVFGVTIPLLVRIMHGHFPCVTKVICFNIPRI